MLNKKGDLGGYIKLTKRSRSFAIFIGVCLTLSLLLGGEYRVIGYIGFFSSIVFLFVFTNLTVKKDKINNMLIFLTVIVLSGCIEGILKGVPFRFAIGDTFRYFLVFFICFITYNSSLSDESLEVVLNSFIVSFLVLLLGCYIQVGFDLSCLESNTFVTTQIGADIFLVIFAILMCNNKNKRKWIIITFLLFVQYIAESRAAFISSIVGIVLYIIFKIRKFKFKWFIYIWIFFCVLIPTIYVWIYTSNFRSILERLFLKYTGHRFFSGRQFIWIRAFEQFEKSPLFGAGVGYRLDTSNLYAGQSEGLSTHNLFLYLLIQIGIVGLIGFVILFVILWKKYHIEGKLKSSGVMSLLLAVLLQQTFSLGLVSGKMGFAVVCWFLLLSGARKRKENG